MKTTPHFGMPAAFLHPITRAHAATMLRMVRSQGRLILRLAPHSYYFNGFNLTAY